MNPAESPAQEEKTPMERAIDFAGSQKALADAIGVSTVFVNQMAKGKKGIPPKQARKIEKATKGTVRREELLPDIFGDVAT